MNEGDAFMPKKFFSISEISQLDFSSLVAVVREPNMCSGGRETIRSIICECNIKNNAKILEVGSNTGYSSIEFAQSLPMSTVIGVDINPTSVEFAKQKANVNNIKNVNFLCNDAKKLPFSDDSFDVVFISNVTSFINEKEEAISEYFRVLRPGGSLIAVPIYYRSNPPIELMKKVSNAIGAILEVWNKNDWIKMISDQKNDLFLYYQEDFCYVKSEDDQIKNYVSMVMEQEHLQQYSPELRESMRKRLEYFYQLFDNNLEYCGFSILCFKYKDANNIPILHRTKSLKYNV